MIEIIYKDRSLIIAYKPAGIPVQPDRSGGDDFMSMLSAELRDMGESDTLYLVHRLDRVVGGLLVFARNKSTAAHLCDAVSTGSMNKEYLAVVEGECSGGVMTDYLVKNTALSKAVVTSKNQSGAKEARLEYRALSTTDTPKGKRTLVKIRLITGRFHQIRAQFSSRGLALIGDGKYGSRDKTVRMPSLFAYRLSVEADECIESVRLPDRDKYPWNLFSEEIYENA